MCGVLLTLLEGGQVSITDLIAFVSLCAVLAGVTTQSSHGLSCKYKDDLMYTKASLKGLLCALIKLFENLPAERVSSLNSSHLVLDEVSWNTVRTTVSGSHDAQIFGIMIYISTL